MANRKVWPLVDADAATAQRFPVTTPRSHPDMRRVAAFAWPTGRSYSTGSSVNVSVRWRTA